MNALIVVDVQNDFMPTGALPVPEGDRVVSVINGLMDQFDLVVATQDWHPADHKSFASKWEGRNPGEIVKLNGIDQILWPDHCIQHTEGAAFHPKLDTSKIVKVFTKGCDTGVDSYSGFFDNDHKSATGLGEYLKANGVKEVSVVGLATEYCVKFTALDAAALGFRTSLILNATRGVDLNPGDVEKAIIELKENEIEVL